MPKRILPLTDVKVRTSKPPTGGGSLKLFDGGGLFLLITPTGGKLWHLKYRYQNQEKKLSLGAYPAVTLADARRRRDDAKKLLANGGDPGNVKKAQKAAKQSAVEDSFEVQARA